MCVTHPHLSKALIIICFLGLGNAKRCGKYVFKILDTLKTPKNMVLRENNTQKRAAGAKKNRFLNKNYLNFLKDPSSYPPWGGGVVSDP